MAREYRREVPLPAGPALGAVAKAAEDWGAGWQPEGSGGRLTLPVSAGVRRGVLSGRLRIEPDAPGSLAVLEIDDAHYRVNWPAVVVLGLGALGGLLATLWPFFPSLIGWLPLAAVLALVAWLLVASRLRSAGPEDFLDLVASHSPEPPRPSGPEPPPAPIEP